MYNTLSNIYPPIKYSCYPTTTQTLLKFSMINFIRITGLPRQPLLYHKFPRKMTIFHNKNLNSKLNSWVSTQLSMISRKNLWPQFENDQQSLRIFLHKKPKYFLYRKSNKLNSLYNNQRTTFQKQTKSFQESTLIFFQIVKESKVHNSSLMSFKNYAILVLKIIGKRQ